MFQLWLDYVYIKISSRDDILFASRDPIPWVLDPWMQTGKPPKEDTFEATGYCELEMSGKVGEEPFVIYIEIPSVEVIGKVEGIKVEASKKERASLLRDWVDLSTREEGDEEDLPLLTMYPISGKYLITSINLNPEHLAEDILDELSSDTNPQWVLSEVEHLLKDVRFWRHPAVYIDVPPGSYTVRQNQRAPS